MFIFLVSLGSFHLLSALGFLFMITWMIPLFSGGVVKRIHLSVLAVVLNLTMMIYYTFSSFYWLNTTPSLEGPNGEGSPLAAILATVFGSAVTLIPWALALYRGGLALREQQQIKHDSALQAAIR